MAIYEDKSNLKNIAISIIFFSMIFNVILGGYAYATNTLSSSEDHIGMGMDRIFSATIGASGRYNVNDEAARRQITSVACTPENPTCEQGLLATTSIQNTGFDPAQEQTNWGKVGRVMAELAAMAFLPIRYAEPLTALSGGTLLASSMIVFALGLWQIIVVWAFFKALKG